MNALAVIAGLFLAQTVAGISFKLDGGTTQCLQEDVEKDILVVGEYSITGNKPVEITLEVRSADATFPNLATWPMQLSCHVPRLDHRLAWPPGVPEGRC